MDAKVPVMDQVYEAFKSFEAHVRRNQMEEIVRPRGVWRQSIGRTINAFTLQRIDPILSERECERS